MQDFKQRRSTPRKPWLKRRFRLSLRRRERASLPKGFRPLPAPAAARRGTPLRLPEVRLAHLARPPLAIVHGAILMWLAIGVCWNGWGLFTAPLEKVRVSGNFKLSGAQVLAAAGLAPGLPMLEVDPIQVTRRLRAEPNVAAVDVRRVYPAAVWIDLRERMPTLRVLSGATLALVDAQDVVIERVPVSESGPARHSLAKGAAVLPLVRGTGAIPEPGQRLQDPGLRRAREFLRQMQEANLPAAQVAEIDTAHPYMLSVRLADGRRVLFSAEHLAAQLRIFRELTASPALGAALGAGDKALDLRAAVAEDGRVVLRP
jgi:cell division septal protein FtsQ